MLSPSGRRSTEKRWAGRTKFVLRPTTLTPSKNFTRWWRREVWRSFAPFQQRGTAEPVTVAFSSKDDLAKKRYFSFKKDFLAPKKFHLFKKLRWTVTKPIAGANLLQIYSFKACYSNCIHSFWLHFSLSDTKWFIT